MKWLRIAFVLALLGALTLDSDQGLQITAAYAQDDGSLTISWIPPTKYTNGAALLEQDLDFYTFNCNDAEVKQIDSVLGTYSNVVDLTALPTGDYICHLTTTSLLTAESGPSNTINFTIGPRVPMAPAGLTSA